jgi:hypothetical protein
MLETGSKQRDDQQRRRFCSRTERLDGIFPLCARPFRGVGPRLRQCRNTHLRAALGEVARSDIAVAAVVAGTAEDQGGHRPGEAVRRLRERRSCPLHQLLDAGAGVDRRLFGGAHLPRREDGSAAHGGCV